MKFRHQPGRERSRIRTIDTLGRELNQLKPLFDPHTDFDPKLKQKLQEGVQRGLGAGIVNMEYFFALFPEFASFASSEWADLERGRIAKGGMSTQEFFRRAERFQLLFPGTPGLQVPADISGSYIETIVYPSDSDTEINRVLFWRLFLLGKQAKSEQQARHELEKARRKVERNLSSTFLSFKEQILELTYFRLAFPDFDISSFLTPEFIENAKILLKDLARPHGVLLPNGTDYAQMAWALTILSAEKLQVTKGVINYQLPNKISQPVPLPERQNI